MADPIYRIFPVFPALAVFLVTTTVGYSGPVEIDFGIDEISIGFCAVDPPAYYAIKVVSTRRLPGTRQAVGVANVTYARSPYGVSISAEGNYIYDVSISIENLKPPTSGVYVVWFTTPDLGLIERIGPLDESNSAQSQIAWNKFLVVVTLEDSDDPAAAKWKGPIAFRGLSRSGFMHTMAGHGPFEQEPCSFVGYE